MSSLIKIFYNNTIFHTFLNCHNSKLTINNIRFIDLQYETKNNLVKTSFEKKELHKNHNMMFR